jgi:hypothetical protein
MIYHYYNDLFLITTDPHLIRRLHHHGARLRIHHVQGTHPARHHEACRPLRALNGNDGVGAGRVRPEEWPGCGAPGLDATEEGEGAGVPDLGSQGERVGTVL